MSTTTQLTWEQFLELEEYEGKQELLDGELINLPPARLNHADISEAIFLLLLNSVPPQYHVRHEVGFRLRRGWLQPDVSVCRKDQEVKDGWLQGAPVIPIEVVSPSNRPAHIDKKIDVYLEEGAAEIWVVYPENRSMKVFREENWERITETYTCALLNFTIDLQKVMPAAELAE